MDIKFLPPKPRDPYDLSQLTNQLEKNALQLQNGSNTKPSTYLNDINFFQLEWLEKETPTQLTPQQIRSISIYLLESFKSFQKLCETDLLPELLLMMEAQESVTILKNIFQLYFQHFLELQEYKTVFERIMKNIIARYKGRNVLLNKYKIYYQKLINPKELLKNISFEEIKKDLNISANSGFYKYLLVIDLTMKLNDLTPDDHQGDQILNEIKKYKNFFYDKNIQIGEYVVQLLIEKMMHYSTDYDYEKWVTYIIDLVGDPRAVSVTSSQYVHWSRIGNKYKEFLIGYLSKEDLVLFLEVISDPEYDEVYRYRKTFWKPFTKYLKYAKLFINNREYLQLDPTLKQRFNTHNSSAYSFTTDSQRSFLYMDFGTIKVIEGTHNAKVRFYHQSPISLLRKKYDYTDFYATAQAQQSLIEEITHRSSEAGQWQSKAFHILKKYIPDLEINLIDTLP